MKGDLDDALVFRRHRQRHVHEWVECDTNLSTLCLGTHKGASLFVTVHEKKNNQLGFSRKAALMLSSQSYLLSCPWKRSTISDLFRLR